MIEILSLGPNDYKYWLGYEGEYLNEAFLAEPTVNLKTWGRFREGYVPGLNALQVVERLYDGKVPDAIVISGNQKGSADSDDLLLFEGLDVLAKKCVVIFRISDPWRFVTYLKEVAATIAPHYYLVISTAFSDMFNDALNGNRGKAVMSPLCIGRRYLNMGMEREYDLGLIGRCELNGERVSPWKLKWKLKVLHEGNLSQVRSKLRSKNYLTRFSPLILNLNQCLASWNSPVKPKGYPDITHTPLRYIEAAACGAITITPYDYPELNNYYFPNDSYLNCDNSLDQAIKMIERLRSDTALFFEIQRRAYRIVMANHQASNRIAFILDLIAGKQNVDPRDYYKIPLAECMA